MSVACIAMLHAIVEMQIRSRPQALVVKARQAQALLQVFLESVEVLQLGCLRRYLPPARSFPEHLITGVHQQSDLVADYESGAIHVGSLGRPIFHDGADSVAAHARVARIHKIRGEAQRLQVFETFGKGKLTRRLSAEEHVTYYNARVPFLLS